MVIISVVLQIITDECECSRLQRIIYDNWDLPGRFLDGGPSVARGTTYGTVDGPGGPSVAAILDPGGPSVATKNCHRWSGGTVGGMTDHIAVYTI